jgi:hypothetical protein
MKKNFLTLASLLFTAIIVNAQDITSYRGAFAPAPVRQWTDSWVNWDPQNAVYGTPNVNVSGTITSNTTWTSNNVYLLQGLVYVDSLVTLTIEPGTVIRGSGGNSSLIVRRGAKLNAEGTPCAPIVFTSNQPAGSRAPGQWGGVLLLGKARHNLGQNILIEGLDGANSANYHGGTDDDDNSGVLKFVRIEYSGFIFSPNNEINGLTMGSVGRGTVLDYIQVSFNDDDAFEWFGGSVSGKHLVSYRNKDDDWDSDNGWSGVVQYGLSIKDPAISDVSESNGFESDNDNPGTNQARQPKTSGSFYNITQIGGFRCTSNSLPATVSATTLHRRGAHLRRNTDLKIINSILMNNWRGVHIQDALAQGNFDQDSLRFRNNIIAGDFTSVWGGGAPYTGTTSLAAFDAATRSRIFNSAYGNDSLNTCALLVNAWSFTNPDYRPNVGGDGAVVTNPSNLNVGADLATYIDIDNNLFSPNQTYEFIAGVVENGGAATAGIVEVIVAKPSGWSITVPGLTLSGTNQSGVNGTSNVGGGQANNNGDFLFREDANNVYITSKPGVIVPKGGALLIGLSATRKPTTSTGTNQNLGVNVSGGGDQSPSNNGAIAGFAAN